MRSWGGHLTWFTLRIAAVLKVDIAFDVFNILSPGEVLGKISMRCLHPCFSQQWVSLSCEIPPVMAEFTVFVGGILVLQPLVVSQSWLAAIVRCSSNLLNCKISSTLFLSLSRFHQPNALGIFCPCFQEWA